MYATYHHEISGVSYHSECSKEGTKGIDDVIVVRSGHRAVLDSFMKCFQSDVMAMGL